MARVPFPGLVPRDASLPEAWERIVTWSRTHFPPLAAGLRPGLTDQELAFFGQAAGQALPDHLRSLYRLANGETGRGVGLFFGLQFMPLAMLMQSLRSWSALLVEDPELAVETAGHSSTPEGAIDARYNKPGWIPIAHDFGGNHLGLDLAPGPKGVSGQVINFGRDEYAKFVLARDLASFLAWMADTLEAGNVRIIDHRGEPGGTYEFLVADPENHHFLDAVRKQQAGA